MAGIGRRTALAGMGALAGLAAGGARAVVPALPPRPLTPDMLRTERKAAHIPAIGAAFRTNGGSPTVMVDGLRSADAAVPVTMADLWHLGSITKSMTATLVARLIESGGVTWDSTVGEVLGAVPQMQASYKNVTFRHLLSHRAGLQPDIPALSRIQFPLDGDGNIADRLKWATIALQQTPMAAPGVAMHYANNGYVVAGAMLERVYKKAWEALMTEHVFRPLKLASAGFGAPGTPGKLDQPLGHNADMFNPMKLKPKPVGPGHFSDNAVAVGPAGRVHMNLTDLTAYMEVHATEARDFLTPASWGVLHTPPFGGDYAMGWSIRQGRLWHNGSNGLWYAEVAFYPLHNPTVAAVVCNDGVIDKVKPAIGRLIDSALAAAAKS